MWALVLVCKWDFSKYVSEGETGYLLYDSMKMVMKRMVHASLYSKTKNL
jgi:hypothetical protein